MTFKLCMTKKRILGNYLGNVYLAGFWTVLVVISQLFFSFFLSVFRKGLTSRMLFRNYSKVEWVCMCVVFFFF